MTLEDFSNRLISKNLISKRLSKFRAWLCEQSLDGYILLHNDNFFSECPPSYANCLYWLSGFSGSCGSSLIFLDKAILFTDGRYQAQARQEVSVDLYEIKHMLLSSPQDWLAKELKTTLNIGYNPNLFNIDIYNRWQKACLANDNIKLRSVSCDPFEFLWSKRPKPPACSVKTQDIIYSGICVSEKKHNLSLMMEEKNWDYAVISDAADVAWLCNIRGDDISYTPLALLRAILTREGVLTLFCDSSRLAFDTKKILSKDMEIKPQSCFVEALSGLSGDSCRVIVDYNSLPLDYYEILKSNNQNILPMSSDFCCLRRACKNRSEIDGSIKAHLADAVAMCRFIYWYHDMMAKSADIDEITAAEYLADLRSSSSLFRGLSFPSISASGSNGAIMHYRVDKSSKASIKPDIPYLIDSGGQYICGTTDITRTLLHRFDSSKNGLADFVLHYTLVLKSLIGVCSLKFPVNSAASAIDGICRFPLWNYGLDYDHSTGHGVGSYLQVHESGQTISMRSKSPLKAGMIVSLEPGYYRVGHYGIRLENLALVEFSDKQKNFLQFKILTLVPFELSLIKTSLLNIEEKKWLNNYHNRCFSSISPLLPASIGSWLKSATKNLPL